MRVFVAGGTGVIGRRAVPALLRAGHHVTVLCRSDANAAVARSTGAAAARTDLFDAAGVRAAVAGHDAVVNLATAIPDANRMVFVRAWATNDRIRTEGARNLVEAAMAAGASHYVQESIAFLYADGGSDWLDVEAAVDPARVTASALEAESQASRMTAAGGTGVALRFGQFIAPESVHLQAMRDLLHKGWLALPGRPDAYASYIDADDAAAAVVAALDVPAGTYNVAEDDPLTRQEHAEVISAAIGRPVKLPPALVGRLPRIRLQARSQRVSNRRLRDASPWVPQCASMRDGWEALFRAMDREAADAG